MLSNPAKNDRPNHTGYSAGKPAVRTAHKVQQESNTFMVATLLQTEARRGSHKHRWAADTRGARGRPTIMHS